MGGGGKRAKNRPKNAPPKNKYILAPKALLEKIQGQSAESEYHLKIVRREALLLLPPHLTRAAIDMCNEWFYEVDYVTKYVCRGFSSPYVNFH